ncbi:UNVERIFIED_CONTAM: hypothetical protein K2H54_024612, partial [Gekko kuhli]
IAYEKKRSIGSRVFASTESQAVGMQCDFKPVSPSLSRHPQETGLAEGEVQIAERTAELFFALLKSRTAWQSGGWEEKAL